MHVAERHRVDRLILTDGVDRPGSGTDVQRQVWPGLSWALTAAGWTIRYGR
jgi:hypothetical protein